MGFSEVLAEHGLVSAVIIALAAAVGKLWLWGQSLTKQLEAARTAHIDDLRATCSRVEKLREKHLRQRTCKTSFFIGNGEDGWKQ